MYIIHIWSITINLCTFERMKRTLFALLLVCFAISGNAQKGFLFGPTANYTTSKVNVIDTLSNNFNFRFRSGFNIGARFHYGFTPNIGINTALLITNKGYRLFNDTNTNGNLLKHNQTFFELPINIVFRQGLNTYSHIRENIGFSFNNSLSKDKQNVSNKNGSFRIEEVTQHKSYFTLNVGLEICKENKIGNAFLFSVFYKHSFANTIHLNVYNNPSSSTPWFKLGYTGSYLSVGISYLFNTKNFKKKDEFFY